MIRAFIAVELPPPVRREIHQLQIKLQETQADVKWTNPDNLHLTLKFLGNIETTQADALQKVLPETVAQTLPFSIQIEGIGAFPKTTAPRVLWVGVSSGEKELVDLAEMIDEACQAQGFESEERPFRGHLTLGRIRSRKQLAGLIKQLQEVEFKAATSSPVRQVVLFQSTLSPQGPRYKRLAEIPLAKPK